MSETYLNIINDDPPQNFPASISKVTGNTDLLTEILLNLPPKSLLILQTVCKHWFSIISSQRFRQLHCRRKHISGKVDGLFFCWWVYGNNYVDFIPINGTPSTKLNCEIMVMNLGFDPLVSDDYRLVCVIKSNGVFEFSVYSSETGIWTDSVEKLDVKQYFLAQGVFLNGCMHWVSEKWDFLRFDLDSLCFRNMASTVICDEDLIRKIRYFGQSGGHLHLIEVHGFSSMSFEVLELETDYSRWFVKYSVDLSALHTAYPLMLSEELDLLDVNRRTCNVVSVVVDEKEKTTRLLVSTPDFLIEYDAHRMTIKEVADIETAKIPVIWEDVSVFEWYDTHRYVETMACV